MSDQLIITEVGERMLYALAHYRYLSIKQMIDARVGRDRGHLGQIVSSFLKPHTPKSKAADKGRPPMEIGELKFGVKTGKGMQDRLYYLTERGAQLIEDHKPELAPVPYRKKQELFHSDYDHRKRIVDFHIMVDQWCRKEKQNCELWLQEFDWSHTTVNGKPAHATRVQLERFYIVPDVIFKTVDRQRTDRLFAAEVSISKSTTGVLKQIQNYCHALDSGAINERFNFQDAVRIMFILDSADQMKKIIERAKKIPLMEEFNRHFFFRNFDTMSKKNLRHNWHTTYSNQTVSLF